MKDRFVAVFQNDDQTNELRSSVDRFFRPPIGGKTNSSKTEQKLTEVGMLHNRSMGVISSSDIPEEFYNALKNQKQDDVFFVPSGTTGTFFKVKSQETRPLTGEDAARFARQQLLRELLRTETNKQAVSAEADAKYEGDYARIMRGEPKAGEKDKAGK